MNVCVFGAGAVGGYLAAHLMSREVADVSIVTLGEHLTAIQKRGLCLREDGREIIVRPVAATATASELPPQDIVFVTLKTLNYAEAAEAIAATIGPDGHAVFVANGVPWWWNYGWREDSGPLPLVDPDGRVWRCITPERALGCVLYSVNEVIAPGVIQHGGNNRWILGEPRNGSTPRLDATVQLLCDAGLRAESSTDLRRHVWAKLARNAPLNSLCALTRLPMEELASDPGLMALLNAVIDEIVAVAAAQGWDITSYATAARQAPLLGGVLDGRPAVRGLTPSMLQDVLAGRPIEVEGIVGQPHSFAREAGIPTPALDSILPLLRGLDRRLREAQGDWPGPL
jgi:2-dehydropantoate 2-reductase